MPLLSSPRLSSSLLSLLSPHPRLASALISLLPIRSSPPAPSPHPHLLFALRTSRAPSPASASVLVKKFLFRSSLDEAIHALHTKIRAGGVTLEGGRFPKEALQLFQQHGVTQPHTPDKSADKVEAQRRYRSTDKRNVAIHGGVGGWDYGKKVMTQPCLHCGRPVEIAGTSTWWGLGRWSALDGCTDDHPTLIAGMEPKHEEDA